MSSRCRAALSTPPQAQSPKRLLPSPDVLSFRARLLPNESVEPSGLTRRLIWPRRPRLAPLGDPPRDILEAAADGFAEKGFAGARVDEIARQAGVNKAMLYYHVGDKAALYEKVILDAVGSVAANLQEGLSRRDDPEGKILAIARAFEAAATEKPHLPRIMMREMAMGGRDLPAPAIEAFAKIIQIEASILEEALRKASLSPPTP